jgi:DNA repair exonuclease SbcCD ATPase subunit
MRIVELELSGFRGFSTTIKFDLDADTVLVIAQNGQGKTSIFDAILWGLSGSVSRLGTEDSKLLSLYSTSGEMYVRLTLRDTDGSLIHLTRSFDGKQQRLMFEINKETYREVGATAKLLEALWPAALTTDDPNLSLSLALTRGVYLQQDLVRHFIESQTEQDRFTAISDLLGTGQITALQVQLDNARSAWSRVTNDLLDEARLKRNRILSLESQIAKVSGFSASEGPIDIQWENWIRHVGALGVELGQLASFDSSDAPLAIDSILKQLQVKRNSAERSKTLAMQLMTDLKAHSEPFLPDENESNKTMSDLQMELETARSVLQETQESAAEERRNQVIRRQSFEELKSLAELALRHLGTKCPVCDQDYDKEATTLRLQRLAESSQSSREPIAQTAIHELAARVERLERTIAAAQAEQSRFSNIRLTHLAWLSDRDRRLRELGIDPTKVAAPTDEVEGILKMLSEDCENLRKAQDQGEALALNIARSSEAARKAEIDKELLAAQSEMGTFDEMLRSRQRTSELATEILDALRESSTEFVDAELKRIEPLLQRIYARIDPHPAFRSVKFLTSFVHRRGRLSMSILDPPAQVSSGSPELVLSSSQINALAISVFLALNIGISRLPLQVAMLDDPLQSLDDINLLGVIDLLRRVKNTRQLLVSTHDARFGDLLARKLRPISAKDRTQVIEIGGWTRQGPSMFAQGEIERDPKPLKIAV